MYKINTPQTARTSAAFTAEYDDSAGSAKMTSADLDESLDYIWRNITSDGRGTEMANQAAPWEGVSAVRRGRPA